MSFVDDYEELPTKSDLYVVPSTVDPAKWVSGGDWNQLIGAVGAVRDAHLVGKLHGFMPQDARPIHPSSEGARYLWVSSADNKLYFYNGEVDVDISSGGAGSVDLTPYETSVHAASTYALASDLGAYETTTHAASTYALASDLGAYETASHAAGTYAVAATVTTALAGKADTARLLTAGTGLTGGGDLSLDRTFALANTTVTPGPYTNANITIDAQGRITAASSGSSGSGTPTLAAAYAAGASAADSTLALDVTRGALTLRYDALLQTVTVGQSWRNSTAATSSAAATQQWSPATVWEGQGWGTTGAASQSVKWGVLLRPVSGTSPTGDLVLYDNINNAAAWTERLAFQGGVGIVTMLGGTGATDTVGQSITIKSGAPGAQSAANRQASGSIVIATNNGAQGVGSFTSSSSGSLSLSTGFGGSSNGTVAGAVSSNINITVGQGGNGSGTAAGGGGGTVQIMAGQGGSGGTTGAPGSAGSLLLYGGWGGAGGSSGTPTAGGLVQVVGGSGGASNNFTVAAGAVGGQVTVNGGTGGGGYGTAGGKGGLVYILGGQGGGFTTSGSYGTGGDVIIDGGLQGNGVASATLDGAINIGATYASSVLIGRTGIVTTIAGRTTHPMGAAATPSIYFGTNTGSGFYGTGLSGVSIASNGALVATFDQGPQLTLGTATITPSSFVTASLQLVLKGGQSTNASTSTDVIISTVNAARTAGNILEVQGAGGVAGMKVDFAGRLTAIAHAGVTSVVASSATPTFNLQLGDYFTNTLTANVTGITFSNALSGQTFTIRFTQNATGTWTVAGWPAAVKFAYGAFDVGTTANAASWITFRYDGTNYYEVARGGDVSQGGWTDLSLTQFTNAGGSDYNAGYWKDSQGIVHLRGRIYKTTAGTAGTVYNFGTLPAGFRPSRPMNWVTGMGATLSLGLIAVDAAGVCSWQGLGTPGGTVADVISLTVVQFKAEQ